MVDNMVVLRLQHTEFVMTFDDACAVFKLLRTAQVTSGYGDSEVIKDAEGEIQITSLSNERIKKMNRRSILEAK